MLIAFQRHGHTYQADLCRPIDVSLPLLATVETVNCFWADPVRYEPVRAGDFVGSVAAGGSVNFLNVHFNPHGNGTHTECVGHISAEPYRLRECFKESHLWAKLVSVYPEKRDNGDCVLTKNALSAAFQPQEAEALLVRTLPNGDWKRRMQYSGVNPPYLDAEAMTWLVESGVRHLLVDLPSVDREEDGGALAAHRAFWHYPSASVRTDCTITELFYAPDAVPDGFYLLNLQIAAFDIDASPSRPLLFEVERR